MNITPITIIVMAKKVFASDLLMIFSKPNRALKPVEDNRAPRRKIQIYLNLSVHLYIIF